MAQIFRNPQVTDYFVELDCTDLNAARRSAVSLYEQGRVALLRGVKIDVDFKFLSSVEFPNTKAWKKFKGQRFLAEWSAGRIWPENLAVELFGGDKGRVSYFAEQMGVVVRSLDRLRRELFPSYEISAERVTWRFADTVNENLHVDAYREDLPDHHLRFFTNIDAIPRIWHTSYLLEEILVRHLHLLAPELLKTATPGRIGLALNHTFFGGWERAGVEGASKHIAFFDPGDVWLVDSRLVSHQIFYGRRAVSTEHVVPVASMNDPSRHYFALIERYRKKYIEKSFI